MSALPTDPVRLCEQRDQQCLTERIAGAAARELVSPARFSAGAMARVAMDIEARRVHRHGSRRRSLALVFAAFLLGVATAASAAHLNLVPSWITHFPWHGPVAPTPDRTAPPRRAAAKSPPRTTAAPAFGAPMVQASAVEAPYASSVVAPALASTNGETQGPLGLGPKARPQEFRARLSKRVAMPGQERVPPLPTTESSSPQSAFPGQRAEPYLAWPVDPVESQATNAERPRPSEPLPPPTIQSASPVAPQAAPRPALPKPALATLPSAAQKTTMRLKEIVRALRVDRAPDRALALLDRHASELGGGAFAEESLLLRVEAMLALGQRDSVLRLLDGTSLVGAATSHTLLLIRGELRASVNRCAEGIGDFDLVVARALHPPRQALLGRARCKERLGDLAGARADLARYRSEPHEDAIDSAETRPAKRPSD